MVALQVQAHISTWQTHVGAQIPIYLAIVLYASLRLIFSFLNFNS